MKLSRYLDISIVIKSVWCTLDDVQMELVFKIKLKHFVVLNMELRLQRISDMYVTWLLRPLVTLDEQRSGIEDVKEEVKYLKSLVQTMSNDIGDIRGRSPTVHCRRSSERRSTSLKRSGVSPIRRPKSSTKLRSHSWSRSSISPSHGVRPDR